MSKYSDLITELGSYVSDVEDIKQSIKDIADNKNITITEDVDTPLSVLEKIDLGTIKTPTETLPITSNGIEDVTNYAEVNVNVPQGEPIEISTSAGMDAVLIADNVGKVYKFTGTTDSTYTNGDLYEVEAST